MMEIENPRLLVLEWLQAGADYDQGSALYVRVGKNRNMAALFPGKKYRLQSKLRYELCKSVGLDWKKLPLVADCSDTAAVIDPISIPGSVSSSILAAFLIDTDSGSCSASASPENEMPVLMTVNSTHGCSRVIMNTVKAIASDASFTCR
jgi:hypothetical protein